MSKHDSGDRAVTRRECALCGSYLKEQIEALRREIKLAVGVGCGSIGILISIFQVISLLRGA